MLDLAVQLPTVVLADLLGLRRNTAARWVHAAGGDWASYVGERTTPSEPDATPVPADALGP